MAAFELVDQLGPTPRETKLTWVALRDQGRPTLRTNCDLEESDQVGEDGGEVLLVHLPPLQHFNIPPLQHSPSSLPPGFVPAAGNFLIDQRSFLFTSAAVPQVINIYFGCNV